MTRGRGARAGTLLGSAALIAAVTLLARATGFGRWLVFSHEVSAQCVGNAYSTANQVPNVLFEVAAGGALAGAVVPLLAAPLTRGREGRADVDATASALLTWAVAVLLPVSLLVAVLAGPLTDALLGSPECPGQRDLAVRMLLVFAPQVVLYGIGTVLVGVLQAHRRFFWPALAPLLSSVVVIGAYAAFGATAAGRQDDAAGLPGGAEAWLAWGTTAGVAAMTLPLLVPVLATGTRLRPSFAFPPGVAVRARALAFAGVSALLAQQASVVAVVWLANHGGVESTLNVYQYTQAVYVLPYAVLAVPLATSAFPRLAERAATGDRTGFAAAAAGTTRVIVLVAVLGAAVVAATAPGVGAFFAALDRGDVGRMPDALTATAPGLVGFALVAHVGRALYALERGRAAAVATAAGWLVVTVGSVVAVVAGSGDDAVVNLGVGSSVGMTVGGVLLLVALARAAGREALAGLRRTGLVALAGGLLGAVAGRAAADGVLGALAASASAATASGGSAAPGLAAAAAAGIVTLMVLAAVTAAFDRDVLRRVRGAA
ncbi:murein biosynthesis integral membrane protein MurJ [Kineosporia sp. R_H_3]|uniref:murein biosynthesis integral membrane protein MurJ n=1 Tax=Kineosporia sp. R_H_3 TaxID=1961848 RepID=UPI0013045300|nr:lipid II flippase MurJ [Kineosporia sp. R_H_3]